MMLSSFRFVRQSSTERVQAGHRTAEHVEVVVRGGPGLILPANGTPGGGLMFRIREEQAVAVRLIPWRGYSRRRLAHSTPPKIRATRESHPAASLFVCVCLPVPIKLEAIYTRCRRAQNQSLGGHGDGENSIITPPCPTSSLTQDRAHGRQT